MTKARLPEAHPNRHKIALHQKPPENLQLISNHHKGTRKGGISYFAFLEFATLWPQGPAQFFIGHKNPGLALGKKHKPKRWVFGFAGLGHGQHTLG